MGCQNWKWTEKKRDDSNPFEVRKKKKTAPPDKRIILKLGGPNEESIERRS